MSGWLLLSWLLVEVLERAIRLTPDGTAPVRMVTRP